MAKQDSQAPRKSRNFKGIVIEPFKQIRLGLYMFGMSIAFIAMTSFIVYSAFTQQYQHVMTIFGIVDPEIKKELVLNDIFIRNGIIIACFFLGFMIMFFYVVFKATHRFFGPLISIERFVRGIVDGDYTQRIVIRRKDELQSLVLKLNEMAATLEKRHGPRVGGMPERRKSDTQGGDRDAG